MNGFWKGLGLVVLVSMSAFAPADEATYYVGHNPKYVNITFESQTDLEAILGSTNQATGEIRIEPALPAGSVRLSIPVASLKTGIDMRDEHLRSEMWLDEKKYPSIVFESKSFKRIEGKGDQFEVTGDFLLHGVTKELTTTVEWKLIPETATKAAKFPEGKWMRFTTAFSVKLSDFGVKIPEIAGGKVSDTWNVKAVIFAGTAKPEPKK